MPLNTCISVTHRVYDGDDASYWSAVYDLDRLLELPEYELGYVQRIIDAAMDGQEIIGTSIKYSFQDCEDWYQSAEVDGVPSGYTVREITLETWK